MEKESIVAPVQIVLDAGAAARQLVSSEIQCHPGFADLYNRLGLLEVYDGRPDRGARSFREALGINPGYFWAAANLAFALVGAGQNDEAVDALSANGLFTSHPDYHLVRAALLIEVDRAEEAMSILEAWPDADAPFAQHLIGMAALHLGRRTEAQRAFLRAASLATPLDRLYRQRELLGPGALEKISPRQAAAPIRIFPGLHELYDFFAEIYARHGFRQRALQSHDEGQVLWPSGARHAWNLGRLASWLGDAGEAKKHFLAAIECDPDLVDAHLALGMECAGEGDTHAAIQQFERAAELRPGYADVRYHLGLTYMEAGRYDDAIGAFRKALSINPAFHFARQNLALALERAGELEESIDEYERLLSSGRRSADLVMHLGIACLKHEDPVKAERMFREGIEINPDFALNYFHLGTACQRQGRKADARAAWREFLDHSRQTELAQEALRQLEA